MKKEEVTSAVSEIALLVWAWLVACLVVTVIAGMSWAINSLK